MITLVQKKVWHRAAARHKTRVLRRAPVTCDSTRFESRLAFSGRLFAFSTPPTLAVLASLLTLCPPVNMVFIPPPHLASASRPSYAEAYAEILATHRRFPLVSAASVTILVAPDVDALCAARMLAGLFQQDDVTHKVIPVSGIAELEQMRESFLTSNEVRFVCLVTIGSSSSLIGKTATHIDSN